MPTRADICAEALRWVDTPFRHQHFHRGYGCDCLGLPRGVGMAVMGFDATVKNPAVRPFANYGEQPEPEKLFAALRLFCDEIPISDARAGDLVVMRWDEASDPSHIGILMPGDYVIHALKTSAKPPSRLGRVVHHRMDERWRNRVVAAFAFRGVV